MKRLFLVCAGLMSVMALWAQTVINVEVHKVVAVDEQFNVTFIIEGENTPSDFSWNPGSDFQLLWGPQKGSSTSISIVNGARTKSSQTTYTYVLKPVKTGKFLLPEAVAKVKGKEIRSEYVQIEVVASRASSQASPNVRQPSQQRQQGSVGDDDIFLELSVDRRNVVIGEPVTATVKLYQRVNVAGFEGASFPAFNGFWSQELEAPSNIEFVRETYDGEIYNAAVLRQYLLIPQQKGEIVINPAELVCLVNVRVSPRGASIFDNFFDDYRTVRKKVASRPVTVNVSPLPAGAPASFASGVGRFSISAKLSKDTLKTHEAASLAVTISGTGNVTLLGAPKVKFPPDVEVYDTKVTEKIDRNRISGSRTFEFPFIPRSHGDFRIEPVQYSYYDVSKGSYVVISTPALDFVVEKGKETESSAVVISGASPKDVKNLSSDIRFINMKSPSLEAKGSFFVGSALFVVMTLLLFAVAALLWFVLRKLAARRRDVVGVRKRKATKKTLRRLRLAETLLHENLYSAFYEELHKALLGFISDKLAIPVAELSKDRMAEALEKAGLAGEYVSRFVALIDACEFARYSPASSNAAMSAHYEEALDVISSIDSEMKENRKMPKQALMLMLLLALPLSAAAQQTEAADSLWNAANQAYVEGRWNDAVAGYEMISDSGLESAALYCNTGDAYFKTGNIPMAILYYERALKLDPSYSDARYNLELLEGRIADRIDPVPEFVLKTWMKDACWLLDSDSWAVCFLVFLALTLAMVLLFLLAPTAAGRRTGFFTGLVTLLFAAFSLGFSIWQKNGYMQTDEAIIMRPVTSVKSSPSSESSQDLFILHEGTKVRIIDEVGTWNNIELADGRQGWLPSADMEII